jgi:predicted HTH transcriptional regulator
MKPSFNDVKQMLNNPASLPESNVLEYKMNYTLASFDKYLQTICSFMNSNGGYIIFGVKDNLLNVGLNKQHNPDTIILKFDEIIHTSLIYGNSTESTSSATTSVLVRISQDNIRVHTVHNKQNKMFIVVNVSGSQEKTERKNESKIIYQLRDGRIYYRLNSSNYLNKTFTIYSEQNIQQLKKEYEQIISNNLLTFQKEFETIELEVFNIEKELESVKQDLIERDQIIKNKDFQMEELLDRLVKQETLIIQKSSLSYVLKQLFGCCLKN